MATKSIEELCGGYSCTFVEKLPVELQTECSICLHTVKEPHLVDCCGYRFCKTCIDPLVSTKRCPLCNGHFTSVMPDKLLQRTLNQKLVYCSFKSEGCEWIGQLSKLDEHVLNCPGKPVVCELCKEFKASRSDVKEHQKSSCPGRLIMCPNGCGGSIKPSKLKAHMDNKCSQGVVRCDFAYAGCLSMMRRTNLKDHLEDSKGEHLVYLIQKVKEMEAEAKKLKSGSAAKDTQIKQLKVQLRKLKRSVVTSGQQSSATEAETTRVLVTNFPPRTDQHMIKSHFGTFGRIKSVKWHADDDVAILEFVLSSSVSRVLEKHCTAAGVVLRGNKLNVYPHTTK